MKRTESSASALGQVDGVSSLQRKAEVGILHCLISSASQTRRNIISQAASDAGWDATVCGGPDVAIGEFKRHKFHFAMIDIDDRGETPAGARELVQTLAQDSSQILVGVCGHEANPAEEIWVRQLGIWLYLPGLTTSSEVSLLCEQALQIVEQRFGQEVTVS
jgi:hypothetical protein